MTWAIDFLLHEEGHLVVKGRMWEVQEDLSNFEVVLGVACCATWPSDQW